MVNCCSVENCSNNAKKDPKLSFFRVPVNTIERCFTWLNAMGRNDLRNKTLEYIHMNVKVCGVHFEDCMFAGMSKSKLKRDAEPTIFNNCEMPETEENNKGPSTSQVEEIAPEMDIQNENVDMLNWLQNSARYESLQIQQLLHELDTLKQKCEMKSSYSEKKRPKVEKLITDDEFLYFCKTTFSEPVYSFIEDELGDVRRKQSA